MDAAEPKAAWFFEGIYQICNACGSKVPRLSKLPCSIKYPPPLQVFPVRGAQVKCRICVNAEESAVLDTWIFWKREKEMFNRKRIIMATVLVLIAAAAMMAAESGSARFAATRAIFVAGTEIKAGPYDVKWEASGQDTAVIFKSVGTTHEIKVQGKIESSDKAYDYNSIVTGKDSSGRDAIKQLQFRGKNIRIVFE
jgi:hypothetical protein